MRTFRIGLAQMNPQVGDLQGNSASILRFLDQARVLACDLVAFPELAICGYPPEDLLLKPSFLRRCRSELDRVAERCHGPVAVVGFPEAAEDLYNAAAVLAEGQVRAIYRKHHLPNYGVFDEDRYFGNGRENFVLGIRGATVGVGICEDIWYANGPHQDQAVAGTADVVVNISASPFHAGKGDRRERMLATRASDYTTSVAFCNLVGGQDELVFDGGSVVFGPSGNLLGRAPKFQEDLLVVDVDLDEVFRERLREPRNRRQRDASVPAKALRRIEIDTSPPAAKRPPIPNLPFQPLAPVTEVYQALVLGTRDYARKNKFERTVLGLSGGIDSSLVACVAADALGPENVVGVSMPSPFSTPHSRSDAKALADNLGMRFETITIDSVFDAYLQVLKGPFGDRKPDVAEENLQARIRGSLLMALSNKFGWLVLTTGNKSEMSTGYATLYGDMAGGFAVIKDVPKTLVYELCRYRNSIGNVIPEAVFIKAPSAELRHDQKDSDTLPPYDVLDPILSAYVERDLDPARIASLGFEPATVSRVVRMVDAAEYKRRQSPPGIKITTRAFGRERRLPVTNRFREDAP